MTEPRPRLRVLVVDDSAVMRQLVPALLARDPGLEVSVAADPPIALRKMERERPDVILLDLEMPRMDGLTFLRKLMREDPIPVVICSEHAGTGRALRALEEGAVEIIAKPRVGLRDFLQESAATLIDAVRAAGAARLDRRWAPRAAEESLPGPLPARAAPAAPRVVAVGASTGGPEALRVILERLPPDGPGLVIVQHMPAGFTTAFASRLNTLCRLEVREARDGDVVVPGLALVAPGDRHVRLIRRGPGYAVEVVDSPPVARHRPSVDVLFHSVARVAGADAVGVLLTGMGSDGAEGLLAMRQAGAPTLAQSEETCVVFGMPKEAIVRGGVDEVVPLPDMARAILARAVRRGSQAAVLRQGAAF